eukprot:TRINITY_DN6912_c1_g3_i1.p1 TRINITY_DN6912_c1_g3~~TRINITY_DN6912_c1_g3_i1.p1  ORF type:complete len:420 (+),score=75.39 TRINITY_DN6912_c1_g3_i1:101-1261(+)
MRAEADGMGRQRPYPVGLFNRNANTTTSHSNTMHQQPHHRNMAAQRRHQLPPAAQLPPSPPVLLGRMPYELSEQVEAKEPTLGLGPEEIKGNVWHYSQDKRGCRDVQHALEAVENDGDRVKLAQELRGHVWEALRCPNANYVLQKCIATMHPQASQFIVDELLGRGTAAVCDAAKHRYGCRSIQRLLEHCRPDQLSQLVDVLLNNCIALSRHVYANYVIQHVLEYGREDQRRQLTRMLVNQIAAVCTNCYACAVVSKALQHSEDDDKRALARAFVHRPGQTSLLTQMARSRHGHVAVRSALNMLKGADYDEAYRQLSADAQALRQSRYGRSVVASLEPYDSFAATASASTTTPPQHDISHPQSPASIASPSRAGIEGYPAGSQMKN